MKLREKASTLAIMELDKAAHEDEMELQRAEMLKKADIVRSVRRKHLERREAEEKGKLVRAEETHDLRNRQIERTYKLADELSRLKNLEAQELLKLRRSKYVSLYPTGCDQANTRARLLEEKVRMEARSIELLEKWKQDKSFNEMQLAIAEEKKRRYCADLQSQIIEKRRILRELDEEKQGERKIAEEMAEAVHEEDLREEERKRETRARLQIEKDSFFEAKRTWKEIRKAAICEENKKIDKAIAEKESEYKKQMEAKSDTRKARETMIENIARKMLDEEIKIKEREDICNELFLETKKNERMKEAIRLILKKQQLTKELQDDMVRYEIAKAEKKMKDHATEEELTRYLYGEWRRLEEQDKQKKEKRRRNTKKYGEELKNIMTTNRIKYATELSEKGRFHEEEVRKECEEKTDTDYGLCDL
ncbi:hypothetical protein KPH14_009952 [Odynerus spinipes]|uniref:Meiosis-specific nuclear structural protein 1 n=1 Tax=Odynerus spinipes TaxID=1348599 RepID=A0AAD9RSX4_9HYME|nr:hypothetical protein KPH14_009952 [Odynerus spinipes]